MTAITETPGTPGSTEGLLFIGGDWVRSASSDVMSITEPASDRELARVPSASAADVARAVEAAGRAATDWWRAGPAARAKAVNRFAALIEANAEDLAVLEARNCGNPLVACRDDVTGAVNKCRDFAAHVSDVKGETVPVTPPDLTFSLREPYGVVGYIVPFNHPVAFAAGAMGPIVVGNTVVLKPAHQTPLTTLKLAELAAECFPPGVFNVVTGGAETGIALAEHPDVRLISFTGGVPAGLSVVRAGARNGLKKTLLELGGKNPLVVFDDADVAAATAAAVRSMNFRRCQGQSCGSTSRVLVHSSLESTVVEAIAESIASIAPGDPLDEDAGMGPLISKAHRSRVSDFVEETRAAGGRVVVGGAKPPDPGLADGAYYLPTLLADVTPDMRVAREEVFGPVISVLPWETEEEAMALANSVPFGLTASVWTRDVHRAQRAATGIQAGRVFVNSGRAHLKGIAYGAFKDSGLGLSGGVAGLSEYMQVKAVSFGGA